MFSPEFISQLIVGALIALGALGVRWSADGRKKARKLRHLEEKFETAISFIYAQRDRSRLHNDRFHPLTDEEPNGESRIPIIRLPKILIGETDGEEE